MARAEGDEILRETFHQGIGLRGWNLVRLGEPGSGPERQTQETETGEYGPQTGP